MTEIRIDFDFGHPPALVWRALTERRQLARWFIPGDLQPVQGSQFHLFPEAFPGFDGPIAGQVLEVSAERRLVMRWKGEQLHATVTWELEAKPEGCLLSVSQSGFLGVRGSTRRQALVSTYDRLFGERLPAVLDGLAGKGDPRVPQPPRPLPPAAPRQHRRRQLLAVLSAAVLIGLVAALLANLPAETSAPANAITTATSGLPPMYASATVAAVTATVVASQPTPSSSPPATPSARATTAATTRPPSASPSTERTATSGPAPAALAARYATLSTTLLGVSYRGEVVVENTGGTAAKSWTLTITVPPLAVVNGLQGPRSASGGAAWTFTGGAVPAGGSARVVFDVLLNLQLGDQQKPLGCQVDGADCAGL